MIFLELFFGNLESKGIDFCVLRNYEGLPLSTNGSDLDMLIKRNKLSAFRETLSETLHKCEGRMVSYIDSKLVPKYCLLGTGPVPWGLMIDLHIEEISYRNQVVIPSNVIWSNIMLHNNISVLNKKTDKLNTLLKELLNNKTCSEFQYYSFVKESLTQEFLDSVFAPQGRYGISDTLIKCQPGNYNSTEIARLVRQLDKDLPGKWYAPFIKVRKLQRILQKPGYSIAFLGTDGAGKSTIIDKVSAVLNETFHNAVYYKHLRPGLLPPLSRFKGEEAIITGPVIDPHASQPSGFSGSLMRWTYYLIDYTLGYYLKVLPKKATKACVFIFDRYYYDYYIDKRRSRIDLPNQIIRIGQSLIPEPDLIVCLGTDPSVIHSRKPELPLAEVERQLNALRVFCKNHKRAVWVDTGKSIEESSYDTINAISGMMTKRFAELNMH